MDIKKADSKGRVSGFEPSTYFRVIQGPSGAVGLVPLSPLESALAEDLEWLDGNGVAS